MQTTLVRQETVSRTDSSDVHGDTATFKGKSHTSDLPVEQGAPPKAKNFFVFSGNGNANGTNRALIEAMINSKIYQDYEKAFSEATGLPVALRPVESWQLPHHGKRNENAFCQMMSQKS